MRHEIARLSRRLTEELASTRQGVLDGLAIYLVSALPLETPSRTVTQYETVLENIDRAFSPSFAMPLRTDGFLRAPGG